MVQEKLTKRILEISKSKGYSHIGSCLSVLPILIDIYERKFKEDIVILDGAHAHLAHLVVREHFEGLEDIDGILDRVGIHCDKEAGCDVSGGSLGHGLGIAIGIALANQNKDVYVILTDGGLMEGSVWEALRIKEELGLSNIHIYLNLNGYTATAEIDRRKLANRVEMFCPFVHVWMTENGEGFDGVQGHYKKL